MNLKTQKILSRILHSLIYIISPLIIYNIFNKYFPNIVSLIIASAFSIVINSYQMIKKHKLDLISILILLEFAFQILAALLGLSTKICLFSQTLIGGGFGVVFLISLLQKRPLIFYLAPKFSSLYNGDKLAWEKRWKTSYFRHGMRIMTFTWGIGLTLGGLIDIALVYQLTTSEFLLDSNVVSYGITGLLILWQLYYSKRFKNKLLKLGDSQIIVQN
ncbi:VC0807 family protein [Sarcina ventriculi]